MKKRKLISLVLAFTLVVTLIVPVWLPVYAIDISGGNITEDSNGGSMDIMEAGSVTEAVYSDDTSIQTSALQAFALSMGADTSVSTWSNLASAVSTAPKDGTETVIDIAANLNTDSLIDVPSGANIVIQSGSGGPYTTTRKNGFTDSFFKVENGGKLTLIDVTLDGDGSNVTAAAPIVYINNTGEFTMDGAAIQNVKGNVNFGLPAGVYVRPGGTMTMKNGSVIEDVVNLTAFGAFYVAGTLNMEDSSVINCTGTNCGGVALFGIFNMNGSSAITGNKGDFGGVMLSTASVFNLSGAPEISGNKKTNGTTPCNVFFGISDRIINVVGTLSNTTPIGVTSYTAVTKSSPATITAASDQDWSGYFTSDNPSYKIRKSGRDSSQVVKLVVSTSIYTWGDLVNAVSAAPDGTETFLDIMADLTADSNCTIDSNKNIVIQSSNGSTITRDSSLLDAGIFDLTNDNATLTLTDITLQGDGTTTYRSAMIWISSYSTFNLDAGAAIKDVTVDYGFGAAGVQLLHGTMYINSGATITNVKNINANDCGSAVFVDGGGGGGSPALNIAGGTITNNVADHGAIYDIIGSTINLSGAPVISGNMKRDNNTDCNWYLYSGANITIGAGGLSNTTPIGVTAMDTPSVGSPINITEASDQDWSGYFTNDDTGYIVQNSGSGSSQVVQLAASTTINVSDSSGSHLPTGVTYDSVNKIFKIDTGNSLSVITVTGDNSTSHNTIAVAAGVSSLVLILNNVSITSQLGGNSPIELQGDANVSIWLADGTTNTLNASSAGGKAGLHVPSTATAVIDGTTGSLEATGGNSTGSVAGAGIGGGNGESGGTITINGGAITAAGGTSATAAGGAGIGGGSNAAGGATTINGGTITATGGGAGSGIGGGNRGAGGNITIGGGVVTATGSNGGAGIGGGNNAAGNFAAGKSITINGGYITATGDGGGAGIGGGNAGGGGPININGGTITAVSPNGSGIGSGFGGSNSTISITNSPIIMATSNSGTAFNEPAIFVASGSGSIINAKLDAALSSSATTYLKCNGNILPLPAGYLDFAFSASASSAVSAYSNSGCTALLGSIVTNPAGLTSIPVTDLSTSPANVTDVMLQTSYTAMVTINKDGSTWTSSPPTIKLYTSSSSLTGEVTGTVLNGVYTFTGLNSAITYYAWDTTNNQYTGRSVTIGSPNATVNYYTVALSSTAGITSTSGSGTYLGGSDVPISATVTGGYNWSKWVLSSNGNLVSTTNAYTITSISTAQSYRAVATVSNAPAIQTTSLPDGTVGTAYSQNLSAMSLAPFTLGWSIAAGSLPTGLSLNASSGEISGTPSASGTFNFTVQATDSNGSSTKALSIAVAAAAPTTYTLTITAGSGGTVSPASGAYAAGATVSITATPNSGYTFSGWSTSNGGSFANASSASTTFTMPGSATTITANWTQNSTGGQHGGDSDGSSSSSGSSSGVSNTPSANNNTIVIVDDKDYSIGTENKNGASTTATVDQGKLTDEISKASENSSVVFPVSDNTSVTAQLVVKNIEDMAKKDMTLTVQTGKVSYNINTSAIDTEKITEALGTTDSKGIPFNVIISNSSIAVNGTTVVVSPVEFTITATYNGKTVNIDTFNSFVGRTIEITADQAKKITTAVVVEQNGSLRHVPTFVYQKDGKWYAKINSLTNSTYTLIWHPQEFTDVEKHWAKNAVNDMGSRMVVSGIGNNKYAPDRAITRAEFAAIIVRALGLAPRKGKSGFSDVEASKWYCGYIETASAYGIIKGYSTTAFGPNDRITREQAMTMIARAMKITGLKMELKDSETEKILMVFSDSAQSSAWAKSSMAACVKTGIVSGKGGNSLAPRDEITRAEVAAIVQRLLQKSGLI